MTQTILNWAQLSATEKQNSLLRPALSLNQTLSSTVADIIEQVKLSGDQALLELTEKFDGVKLEQVRLTENNLCATDDLSLDVKAAIDTAYEQIKAFHVAQQVSDIKVETTPGVKCELKHTPIENVGLYVPGGSAPLPSTVLMLGVTAQVAGCKRKVLCTPANKKGTVAAEIRYAAQLCGISEIYMVGGAQAIAAMAYGTESIKKVDKIFGPGNSYVTEAKQQVSNDASGAAIDLPAGPSEVLVIADQQAEAKFIAADLLSQAEHGPDSQVVLVSDSEQLIVDTQLNVQQQLTALSRAGIANKALSNARYVLTETLEQAVEVSNAYAPEHLIVMTKKPRDLLDSVNNAGSIFLGKWSPESAGDYASGTNHVLPTYGFARNYSSLGLADFYRRYTVQELSYDGLQSLGDCIMTLAQAEGLDAHRNAVAIRLGQEQ